MIERYSDKEIYFTKNLNLAAYLYASGLELFDTDNLNGEYFFKFVPKADAELLVSKYFAGRATVDPRELFARLNDLKDIIFSSR